MDGWMRGLMVVIGLALSSGLPSGAAAEDVEGALADQLSPDSVISREAWTQKVRQARERAEQARREAAAQPRGEAPLPPSREWLATDRVLSDETLQAGDVVATESGLFVVRGRSASGELILQPLPRRP
jgi:hypothetical protein